MPKKVEYPEWVMTHKKKGTYINRVGDKYYLYAAHSERIKGTGKVRRVCDGYIGRITQEDGLIPARPKLKSPPVSYEIGLSYFIMSLTENILSGLRKSYRKNADLIYSCSILSFIYGKTSLDLFYGSYLSVRFDNVSYPDKFTDSQSSGIERGIRMISDTVKNILGDEAEIIARLFPDVRLIKADNYFYLCGLNEDILTLSKKYSLEWEEQLWQK